MSESSATNETLSFKLAGIPGERRVIAFPIIFLFAVEAVLLALSSIDGLSLKSALLWLPVGLALLVTWAVGMLMGGWGSVKMSADGLRIEALTGTLKFKWEDIAAVETEPEPPLWLWAQSREGQPQVIALKLSRSVRIGFHPWRSGTDVIGIPTYVKVTRLKVENTERFLFTARSFMRPLTPKTSTSRKNNASLKT